MVHAGDLMTDPILGNGALGFLRALHQVYPETVHQRCWFHKIGNVLNALAKSLQGKAKADLQAIWMAPTRTQANQAFQRFINRYGAKYPEGDREVKDREALLAFFAFPAEHRAHLRTTNPDRVDLRYRAPPHQPDQELRHPRDLPRPGLQDEPKRPPRPGGASMPRRKWPSCSGATSGGAALMSSCSTDARLIVIPTSSCLEGEVTNSNRFQITPRPTRV